VNEKVPSQVAVEEQKPLLPSSLVTEIEERVTVAGSPPVTVMLPFLPPISVVVYLQVIPAHVHCHVTGDTTLSAPLPPPDEVEVRAYGLASDALAEALVQDPSEDVQLKNVHDVILPMPS
jgi:hypothetical protein